MTVMAQEAHVPIADVVRDAIRQRLLPPGMALIQGALADALGVSRVPVRGALQYLASEGLVTFTDEGARVTARGGRRLGGWLELHLGGRPRLRHAPSCASGWFHLQ